MDLKQRIEAACEAFLPAWPAIVKNDDELATLTRERMRKALAAGDPVIDIGITEAQADALARDAADKALDELEYGYEIVTGLIGEEWRESALASVAAKIRPVLMALARTTPRPPLPDAGVLAGAALALTAMPTITCPKCSATVPVGAMCKELDCPLNPGWQDRVVVGPRRGFVEVTPPQGGRGSTVTL